MRTLVGAMAVGLAVVSAGCTVAGGGSAGSPSPTLGTPGGGTPSAGTPAPTPTLSPSPAFASTVSPIGPDTRARMRFSWHQGCPVPLEDLRLVSLSYWGFDGRPHQGELVVHRVVVSGVVKVFHRLFDLRFPIRRMSLVDAYQGDDDRSMAADNTSPT